MALAKLCAIVSLAALVVTACGESVSPYYTGGDVTVQITSSGLERQFMVHVPPSLSPRVPAPAGSGGSASPRPPRASIGAVGEEARPDFAGGSGRGEGEEARSGWSAISRAPRFPLVSTA